MKVTDERYKGNQETNKKRRRKQSKGTVIAITLCVSAAIAAGGLLGYTLAGGFDETKRITVSAQDKKQTSAADTSVNTAIPDAAPESSTESTGKFSIPSPSETTDLIDIIAAARRQGMTNRCYLTFDDGPSVKVTGQILDILAKHNAKATFFEVGRHITEHPEITKRVHDEGHLVANHSYSHDYNALYATEESFSSEIKRCEEAIKSATGQSEIFKLVRFPGGSYNAGDHAAEKQVYKKTLADMGYYYCDWNALNGDAEGTSKDTAGLIQFFKSCAASFVEQDKNLIVLMHDSDTKQSTVDALETIIVWLKEYGYTFHTLDDITVN